VDVEQGRDEYLSQRQAARRYGLSPDTIRRRIKDGQLPVYARPMNDKVRLLKTTDLERLMKLRPAVSEKAA